MLSRRPHRFVWYVAPFALIALTLAIVFWPRKIASPPPSATFGDSTSSETELTSASYTPSDESVRTAPTPAFVQQQPAPTAAPESATTPAPEVVYVPFFVPIPVPAPVPPPAPAAATATPLPDNVAPPATARPVDAPPTTPTTATTPDLRFLYLRGLDLGNAAGDAVNGPSANRRGPPGIVPDGG